jgi:hypothetical protein
MTRRLPLLLLALLALLAALWAGLIRIGWALPAGPVPIAQHGALMLSAFLGTVIALERAVALGRPAPYAAPLLTGLGGLALLVGLPAGLPAETGRALITLGSLGLVAIFAYILRRRPDAAHATMALGALLWLAGNALWWAGRPLAAVAPWWIGFLVLTIAGERLELARVIWRAGTPKAAFLAVIAVFLAGLLAGLFAPEAGWRLSGLGLAALGLWLLRFDLARRTIRQTGLTRYIAACLLPGYLWLALGGALWLIYGGQATAGPLYDALLHSVLLGFVFSLIFGHAPVIIPGVLRVPLAYAPGFYLHLALLHASLIVRVAGDLLGQPAWRQWGGLFNVIAVLWFLGATAWAVRRAAAAQPVAAGA